MFLTVILHFRKLYVWILIYLYLFCLPLFVSLCLFVPICFLRTLLVCVCKLCAICILVLPMLYCKVIELICFCEICFVIFHIKTRFIFLCLFFFSLQVRLDEQLLCKMYNLVSELLAMQLFTVILCNSLFIRNERRKTNNFFPYEIIIFFLAV